MGTVAMAGCGGVGFSTISFSSGRQAGKVFTLELLEEIVQYLREHGVKGPLFIVSSAGVVQISPATDGEAPAMLVSGGGQIPQCRPLREAVAFYDECFAVLPKWCGKGPYLTLRHALKSAHRANFAASFLGRSIKFLHLRLKRPAVPKGARPALDLLQLEAGADDPDGDDIYFACAGPKGVAL